MRINEIFYSIQGEGRFTGTPAVFLRFSGCNLRCPFCDTDHSAFEELSEAEIVSRVGKYPARHLVVTGGEPLLQFQESLARALHREGFFIQVETNGTIALGEGLEKLVDWVTCSPKSLPVNLKRIDELKVVFKGQALEPYAGIPLTDGGCRCLQPCDEGDPVRNEANLRAAIECVKADPGWRLSLQMHKLMGIK